MCKILLFLSSAGTEEDLILGVDKITWPYILSGLWCALFSLCYAVLGMMYNVFVRFDIKISIQRKLVTSTLISIVALLPFSMPRYYEHDQIENDQDMNTNRREIRLWKPLLIVTFFYYFFSCGIERIYQPMVSWNPALIHWRRLLKRISTLLKFYNDLILI